ncbi:MAG: type II toxin-antitoxin system VapC family toxin [Acidimicrobiia bacterium]
MTRVVDASLIVAAVVDAGPEGRWAEKLLASSGLAAPHLIHAECANAYRRAERSGDLSADLSRQALQDTLSTRIALYAFEPFAERIWGLRETVTLYDAWYVALAEFLDAPLATLDRSLANAPGPACRFEIPG